jgi:hypothetical protein
MATPQELADELWPRLSYDRLLRILQELDQANRLHGDAAAQRDAAQHENVRLRAEVQVLRGRS